MRKVLLVEDSVECQLVVRTAMSRLKVDLVVANTLKEAHEILDGPLGEDVELVLLDLVLPDGDGLHFLERATRRRSDAPTPSVILLTSRADVAFKVTAFSLGAEDYLVKPIDPLELKARMEVRFRRSDTRERVQDTLRKGDLVLHPSQMKAVVQGAQGASEELELTTKEFRILTFLADHEGQVYTRKELVRAIWGNKVHVLDRTIDSHVCSLRKKLKDMARYIECVPGAGYRFRTESDGPHSIQTL